ncbi:MAG: S46 family peptidase [Bacteroidales bacterium]|jgi:hypothetical protein
MNQLKKTLTLLLLLVLATGRILVAEEGMWIPLLLEKYKIADMQKAGFKLTAEDIYSVNQASMKDAIVIFGGGCTGEMISAEGLLITNHHCGYGTIQRLSTVENDYLTNGFWAMSRAEELPAPGLSVTFLVRIEDVTERCLAGVNESMSAAERNRVIGENSRTIQNEATQGNDYTARIAPFFSGNQYFLFVYELYRDVRLVGAPPSAIGKFGGETDNWIWPRHTGDFSLFRVYAGPDNKPAAYSPDNKPYVPKKHFPISLKGVEKGDFTMVFGYPGRTTQYIPSFSIEGQANYTIPASIDLQTKKLDIIMASMEISPKIRLQYSAKKSGIANGWKKNQGVLLGLNRIKAIDRKIEYEKQFQEWVQQDPERVKKYGTLLENYRKIAEAEVPFQMASVYARNAGAAAEIFNFAGRFLSLLDAAQSKNREEVARLQERLKPMIASHFKDYHAPTDQQILASLMEAYSNGIEEAYQPKLLPEIREQFKGDFAAYAAMVFDKSVFASEESTTRMLETISVSKAKKLKKDPAIQMFMSLSELQREVISPGLIPAQRQLPELQRLYMAAQMEMEPERLFYPDANSTIRVTFGQVSDYAPMDGVKYHHLTTLEGIIEKDNPDIYDYRVPEKLKELYRTKDYGDYATREGQIPVCFIASNHTSGGNSGSPVVNADGHLIGVNFDRNWQGTMSDIMYDPDLCRNISLDIRYALFIIDRFAGAKHIIEELDLVR